MQGIEHYYVCLGCGSRHPSDREAIHCCAVVQEVWECVTCGKRHAGPDSARACIDTHRQGDD